MKGYVEVKLGLRSNVLQLCGVDVKVSSYSSLLVAHDACNFSAESDLWPITLDPSSLSSIDDTCGKAYYSS